MTITSDERERGYTKMQRFFWYAKNAKGADANGIVSVENGLSADAWSIAMKNAKQRLGSAVIIKRFVMI